MFRSSTTLDLLLQKVWSKFIWFPGKKFYIELTTRPSMESASSEQNKPLVRCGCEETALMVNTQHKFWMYLWYWSECFSVYSEKSDT